MHVIPMGDLIEHDSDEDCVCGPQCDPVERDDGSFGWVYVHTALDGRESPDLDGATTNYVGWLFRVLYGFRS